MCSFKIGKISYSKSKSIKTDDGSKNKPSLYPPRPRDLLLSL